MAGVGGAAASGGKGHQPWCRQVPGVDGGRPTAADDGHLGGDWVDDHDRRGTRGGGGDGRHLITEGPHGGERGVGQVERVVAEDAEPAGTGIGPGRDHTPAREEGVGRLSEHPVGPGELGLHGLERGAVAVEVPPAGAIGDPVEGAVG